MKVINFFPKNMVFIHVKNVEVINSFLIKGLLIEKVTQPTQIDLYVLRFWAIYNLQYETAFNHTY